MSNLDRAKGLLRYADAKIFMDMICDLGIGEDILFELACDSLENLPDEELQNFINTYGENNG